MRRLQILLGVISLIGMAASAYALYLHYAPTASSFCNVSATLNCDLVNRSTYAELLGVPVALMGALGYLALLLGSIFLSKIKQIPFLLLLASIGGLVFSLYLTGIEAFVLKTYCIVCIISQVCILIATILTTSIYRISRKGFQSPTIL